MTNDTPACCGGTGIGCPDHEPTVRLCRPEDVPAMSREFGIPVSGGPDGRHYPSCGGCQGRADRTTCPYSVRLAEYAAQFNAGAKLTEETR